MNIKNSALILIDMQNDYLHGNGAFGRADIRIARSRSLVEPLIKICNLMRQREGIIVSVQYTIVANKDNNPIIPAKLKKARPFLKRGDFQIGRWGHQLIDQLAPADYTIDKVNSSAFHMTHLDWLLKHFSIDTLFFAGMVNENSMADTLKEAQKKGFETVLLSDGCAAYNPTNLRKCVSSLSGVSKVKTCQEIISLLKGKS